jgi:hypothetical protein
MSESDVGINADDDPCLFETGNLAFAEFGCIRLLANDAASSHAWLETVSPPPVLYGGGSDRDWYVVAARMAGSVMSPQRDSFITIQRRGRTRPGQQARRGITPPGRSGLARSLAARVISVGCLVAAILLASVTVAGAQVSHDSPEWDGKDHQPTQAEVIRRENEDRLRAPPAEVEQHERTLEQLDRQLLHDQAVNPPSDHSSATPP